MDSTQQALRAYYEEEARLRLRKPVTGRRAELRDEFLYLTHANGVLAAERGVRVVQGSVDAPPFRAGCFDAGWSMSTLMHFPEDEVPRILSAMTAPLCPGAPLFVGLWGGDQGDVISEVGLDGHRRLFSLRPFVVNHRLFAACAEVEQASLWDLGVDEWQYQVFKLRVVAEPAPP